MKVSTEVREKIAQMRNAAVPITQIAQELGLSTKDVRSQIPSLVRSGKCESFGRQPRGHTEVVKRNTEKRVAKPKANGSQVVDIETAADILLEGLVARKELPQVKAELERFKRGYENAVEALESLRSKDKKQQDKALAFRLAQQQGEIGGR